MEYKGKERGYRGRGGGRGGRHGGNGRGHGGRGRGRDGRGRGRGGGDGRANRHSSEEFTNYQKEYINQCEKILTIITDKNYKYISSDEEKIDLGQEMSKCINLTLFKKSLTKPSKKEFKPNQCEINMSKLSTIGCARDMHQKGFKNIVVMNFASPFKPGGFYKKGKSSQEMNIISQTLLFGSLLSEAAKPFYFQRDKADDYDFYNNGLIYSPHVPVIADGEARLKEAREKDEEQSTSHYKKKFILYGEKNVFYIDVISISSISNSLIRRVQGGGRKFRGNDDGNNRRGGYHNHSDRQKDYNQRRGSHDDNDRRHGDRDDYHGGRHDRGDHRQGDRNDHRGGRNDRDHDDHRGGRHDRDHDDHHRHGSDDMIKSAMEQKIRNTIYMAVSANADALVLGAFGCGSSGNHPSTISKLFKKVLIEDGYASYFKRIDFSLPEIFPKGKVDIIQVFSKNLLISKKCSSDSDSSNNDEYVDNDEEEEEEEFNESDSNKNDDDDNDYDHRDDSKAKNDKAGKNENKAKNDNARKNDNKKKSDNKSKNSKQKQDDKEKNDDECSNSDNEEK